MNIGSCERYVVKEKGEHLLFQVLRQSKNNYELSYCNVNYCVIIFNNYSSERKVNYEIEKIIAKRLNYWMSDIYLYLYRLQR